jgi:hypothetical protein
MFEGPEAATRFIPGRGCIPHAGAAPRFITLHVRINAWMHKIATDGDYRSKFIQADRDGDGVLTFREWLNTQSRPATLEAHAHWAKFDTEGKGYLTVQEAFERRATWP